MTAEFWIVVDANVMKDYAEASLKSYEDNTHKSHVIHAEELFKKIKDNIKICLDDDKETSKILSEYKVRIGEVLLNQCIVQLAQDRLRFLAKEDINGLSTTEKKKLVSKGFDRADFVYVNVAKSINNKRFVITRDRTFYNPKNTKDIGNLKTVMAIHLKKKFDIQVRIAKDCLCESDLCP
jgi:hypothetical protein